MKTVFIFDIDGTLIDSNDQHAKAWQGAFRIFGKNISLAQVRTQMGKGSDQLLPEFLSSRERKQFGEELTELRDKIFHLRYVSEVRAFPGVRELFRAIRKRGGRTAVASSSNQEDVKRFLEIARIEDLVEKFTSSDDAQSSKPEPDVFHSILKKLRRPPKEHVLVVGDTPYDAMAARKAKLRVIGVLCGGFSKRELVANGCEAVYRDPRAVLANLDEIMGV